MKQMTVPVVLVAGLLLGSLPSGSARGAGRPPTEPPAWEFVRGGFKTVRHLVAVAPDDIWGAGGGGIFHFDGQDGRLVVELGENGATAIDFADGVGWAAAGASMLRFDGQKWTEEPRPIAGPGGTPDIDLIGPGEGYALVAVTDTDGGWDTALMQLRGEQWLDTGARINGSYTSLAVVGPDEAWTVGPSGIAHFDGVRWSVEVAGEGAFLDLAMLDARSGWAVGGTAAPSRSSRTTLIWQYEDGVWRRVRSSPGEPLYAVAARSSTEAIAGGMNGTILRYDGRTWSLVDSLGGGHFARLEAATYVTQTGRAYLGAAGEYGGRIVAVDGASVQDVHGAFITRLDVRSPTDVWAIRGEEVWRYGGSRWRMAPSLPQGRRWTDVAAIGPDDVWATGAEGPIDALQGTIAHYDGTTWRLASLPSAPVSQTVSIHRIAFASEHEAWALGRLYDPVADELTMLFFHYDGNAWTLRHRHPAPASQWPLEDIAVNGSGEVWALGNGYGVHFSGGSWSQVDLPADAWRVTSLSLLPDGSGWAVAGSSILRLDRGTWVNDHVLADGAPLPSLQAIHAQGPWDIWAVGVNSNAVHFAGEVWERARAFGDPPGSGVSENLWMMVDVDAVAIDDHLAEVWMVGQADTILRGRYSLAPAPPTPTASPSPTMPVRLSVYLPLCRNDRAVALRGRVRARHASPLHSIPSTRATSRPPQK